MKKYAKMLAGMLIGVLGSLALTLNIWGDSWYKIAISALVGIIAGMFVTDYKASAGIFNTIFNSAAKVFTRKKKTVSAYDKNVNKVLFFQIIGALSLFSFFALMVCATVFCSCNFSNHCIVSSRLFIMTAASAFLIIDLIMSLNFPGRWRLHYGYKPQHKIWGDKSSESSTERYFLDFEEAIAGLSYGETFKRCFVSTFLTFKGMVLRQLRWLYYDLPLFIVSLVIMLLLLLPWLVRGIGKHSHLMAVSFSIVLGCVSGTLTHSFLVGISVGTAVIGVNYVCSLFKSIDPVWAFKNINAKHVPYALSRI